MDARDEWDEFFDEIYLTTYLPRLAAADARSAALAAVALAGLPIGGDVLDVPCGFGRHSIPLAQAGYRVTGADRSKPQLARARADAEDPENPRFVHADHRELPFAEASFDCALNLFTSLGYRGEDGDRSTLGELHRVLRPGASLVIETIHRDRLMAIFRAADWEELPEEALLLERRAFDCVTGEVETKHMLVRLDGTRRSFTYRIRTYTATELVGLVRDAGFSEIAAYGGLGGEELTRETRLVLLARA